MLGVELKSEHLKDAMVADMVTKGHNELIAPAGAPSTYEMVGWIARSSCTPKSGSARALRPLP
jgi:hypothetical protein